MPLISFDDIFGQPRAIEFLRATATADRLPHALVFAGPVGVGKATTALALAAWFLCQKPLPARACGKCESCRALAAGIHPDFHLVMREQIRQHDKSGKSKGTQLAIEVIRGELVAPASRTAVLGRGKFFVVEQAELATAQAQNAMLKTLEEPAGRSVIVLLTDSPEFLLPTILSRCQMVRFGSLPVDLVKKRLQERGIETAVAAEAAELSDGSLGGAMRLISEGILPAARALHEQLNTLLVGRVPADLPGWFKQAADDYAEKELIRDPLGSKEFATRGGLTTYLSLAARFFRRQLYESSDATRWDQACRAIDAIARCQMYMDANVNVPVALGQLGAAWAGQFAAAT
jgi:DNA polymerase III subunit delta'